MNKLKLFKTKSLLASLSLITMLSGCARQIPYEDNSIEQTYEIETKEEAEEIKEEIVEKDEYTKDEYDIRETYLNISHVYEVSISDHQDEKMKKSISLEELISLYGFNLKYNPETNLITKEDLKQTVNSIQAKITELKEMHQSFPKINIDNITIFDAFDIQDGKLICKLILNEFDYKKWYESLKDEKTKEKAKVELQKYELSKYSFSKIYKDFIISYGDNSYISLIDYVLLNESISYTRNLEDMFPKLSYITDKEIDTYKKGVLKKYNIDFDNNTSLFDPNNLEDIKQVFDSYISANIKEDKKLKEQFENNNIDYEKIVLNYIALNMNLLSDETLETIKDNYLNPIYKNVTVAQLKDLALIKYVASPNQESLASKKGYYDSLKTITDYYKEADSIELEHQNISENNHPKACQELYLIQKVYNSLKKQSTIDEIIINSLVKIYIDIDIRALQEINFPNTILEPNERDYTWIYLMLLDDYNQNEQDSLCNNFDLALQKNNKEKEQTK